MYRRFSSGILAGITVFRWKIALGNLNSQQNLYDNATLVVLSRLTELSAKLPAILEKCREFSKKVTPRSDFFCILDLPELTDLIGLRCFTFLMAGQRKPGLVHLRKDAPGLHQVGA